MAKRKTAQVVIEDHRYPPSRKRTGRPPGVPNRSILFALNKLEELDFDPILEIKKLMPQLEPRDQADVLLRMLPFCYAELKAVTIDAKLDAEVSPQTVAQTSALLEQVGKIWQESVIEVKPCPGPKSASPLEQPSSGSASSMAPLKRE